jgi:hypothetical protein
VRFEGLPDFIGDGVAAKLGNQAQLGVLVGLEPRVPAK